MFSSSRSVSPFWAWAASSREAHWRTAPRWSFPLPLSDTPEKSAAFWSQASVRPRASNCFWIQKKYRAINLTEPPSVLQQHAWSEMSRRCTQKGQLPGSSLIMGQTWTNNEWKGKHILKFHEAGDVHCSSRKHKHTILDSQSATLSKRSFSSVFIYIPYQKF